MIQKNKNPVFIVDDDQDDRESIRDAFIQNKHLHDYVFMENGIQLMTHLAAAKVESHPSLILLDLNMPGKDGRDVLREIKRNDGLKPIPVIVISTSSAERDRVASYDLGANCFITKPDTYTELLEITDAIARLWF